MMPFVSAGEIHSNILQNRMRDAWIHIGVEITASFSYPFSFVRSFVMMSVNPIPTD